MLHHGNDNYNIILISKYEVDLRLSDRRLADVDIRLVSMHSHALGNDAADTAAWIPVCCKPTKFQKQQIN